MFTLRLVPRETVMAIPRWMGLGEAEVVLVVVVLQHRKPIVRLFIKAPKLVHMLTNVF